ncbi:MAG: hypothetical protein SPE19_00045 [Candidatus Faecousia sp.]|nr:hypothetical protein [Candidatus Faecousia sp.]
MDFMVTSENELTIDNNAYRLKSASRQIGVYSFQAPYVATVGADIIRPKRSGF